MLLRVVSMRGAAFAALLLFGASWVSAAALLLRALFSGGVLLWLLQCYFVGVAGAGFASVISPGGSSGAAAPHLLRVACSVFGSLRAVLACYVGGPRFGVPSGRGYLFGVLLMIAARTLCGLCATPATQNDSRPKKWMFFKNCDNRFFANFFATKFWRCIIKLNIPIPKLK